MPLNTVYVGRPGKWGNPYKTAAEYRENVIPTLSWEDVKELQGKNLACWCKVGDPCHANLLLVFVHFKAEGKDQDIEDLVKGKYDCYPRRYS